MLKEAFTLITVLLTLGQGSISDSQITQTQSQTLDLKQSSISQISTTKVVRVNQENIQVNYLNKISDLGINLHSEAADSNAVQSNSLNHCAEIVYKTLQKLPTEAVSKLDNLTLHFDESARRGLAGGSTAYIRCVNVTDAELVAVLFHEVGGHIEDTGVFNGNFWAGESKFHDGKNPIYNDDLSLEFYQLSFEDEKTRKKTSSDLDFVSGYAMSDPFEDFAETITYYRLHGLEFKKLMKNNSILKKKYNFMKEKVFNNAEFDTGNLNNIADSTKRNYDTTILDYNLTNFFAI